MARRRLRVGVCRRVGETASIVAERIFEAGEDITLGGDATAGLAVPGWTGPSVLLIEGGDVLELEPGMRLHMCHDHGEDRVEGTFEELVAMGVSLPIRINVSKLNIRVRDDISVFAYYLPEEDAR
jgi:hypothetical protein